MSGTSLEPQLHMLVRSRGNAGAANHPLRKLMKRQARVPRVTVTDKLRSYRAAARERHLRGCDYCARVA